MSNSLWPHELQHARLLCPSLSPWVCSNSCTLSQWCHLILCLPLLLPSIFPSIRVFSSESLFTSGGQSIGASASASIRSMNIQDGLVWSPCCSRDSQESSPALHFKRVYSLAFSLLYELSQAYMTTGKNITLTIWTFVIKVMSLLFNTLSLS